MDKKIDTFYYVVVILSARGDFVKERRFSANLLGDDDALAAMDRFRMTPEKLAAGQALVEQTEALSQTQEQEKGKAKRATLERDAALVELYEWMGEFKVVAKIALADDAQLLEGLGLWSDWVRFYRLELFWYCVHLVIGGFLGGRGGRGDRAPTMTTFSRNVQ